MNQKTMPKPKQKKKKQNIDIEIQPQVVSECKRYSFIAYRNTPFFVVLIWTQKNKKKKKHHEPRKRWLDIIQSLHLNELFKRFSALLTRNTNNDEKKENVLRLDL